MGFVLEKIAMQSGVWLRRRVLCRCHFGKLYTCLSVWESWELLKFQLSCPFAGQVGMQRWLSASVAGGSCESEQQCRMVVGDGAGEDLYCKAS